MLKLKSILWPPDVKNWLIRKDPDAGQDWRWEEKGMTEDEMVGGHHRFNGHEFEQAPGVGDGQGSLAYCSPWGRTESDMTEQLNWTDVDHLGENETGPTQQREGQRKGKGAAQPQRKERTTELEKQPEEKTKDGSKVWGWDDQSGQRKPVSLDRKLF